MANERILYSNIIVPTYVQAKLEWPSFEEVLPGFEQIRKNLSDFFLIVEYLRLTGFPIAVGAVVTRDDGGKVEILLVKSIDHKDAWSNPAGHVEHDEFIPEALARELLEETGLSTKNARMQVTALVNVSKTSNGTTYLLFSVQVFGNFVPQPIDTQEIGECGWYSLNETLQKLLEQNGKTHQILLDYLNDVEVLLNNNIQTVLAKIPGEILAIKRLHTDY